MKERPVHVFLLASLLAFHALPASAQPAEAPAPVDSPPPVAAPVSPALPAPAPAAAPPEPVADAPSAPPAAIPPEASAPAPETPKPKPPPYSLPWQLRSVIPANAVRSDTSIGFYESPSTRGGTAVVSMLSASYKLVPELAPVVRVGLVSNAPPTDKSTRTNLTNPVLGVLYGPKLPKTSSLACFSG